MGLAGEAGWGDGLAWRERIASSGGGSDRLGRSGGSGRWAGPEVGTQAVAGAPGFASAFREVCTRSHAFCGLSTSHTPSLAITIKTSVEVSSRVTSCGASPPMIPGGGKSGFSSDVSLVALPALHRTAQELPTDATCSTP